MGTSAKDPITAINASPELIMSFLAQKMPLIQAERRVTCPAISLTPLRR